MKTVGIIGGMVPQGTGDLYMGIVRTFQHRFGARYDADFPPMLLHSVPAPELVERLEDEQALAEMLVSSARTLEAAGADFLAIACNTAHVVHRRVAEAVAIPVLHLPSEVAKAVARNGHDRVGLLATGLTLERGLYRGPCEQHGIAILEPSHAWRSAVTGVIMAVLAGEDLTAAKQTAASLIDDLTGAGAQAVILGCTDLGPVVRGLSLDVPAYDSTIVLAEACVREALAGG